MQNNEILIEMNMDISDFEDQLKKSEAKARDTWSKIDSALVVKMRLNIDDIDQKIKSAKLKLKTLDEDTLEAKKLRLDILQYKTSLTEAKRQLNNYVNTWETSISRLQAKFDSVNKNINWVNSTIWRLQASFKEKITVMTKWFSWINSILWTIWVSLSTYFSAQKVVELSDSFTNLNNRLKQVAEWDSLDTLRNKIFEAANSARADVETYAAAFTRFDLVNKQLWGSQEETLIIMDSLAKWLWSTWAAASEVNSVMLQLSQAFWSWKLSWDEFRSVSENMPWLLDILAKKLWVSRWALKDMAAEWKITSEVLKWALLDANEQLNESFEKSSVTIGQAMTVATNKFIKKFWEMDWAYWITQKITAAIWTLWDGFIAFVEIVAFSVNVFWKLINTIPATVWTALILVSETFIWTFKTIWKNTSILLDNIWVVFQNWLPNAVKMWANWALVVMEGFINKVWKAVTNLFSKIPWFESLKDMWTVSLWRFDTVWWSWLKSFESWFDFSYSIKSAEKAKWVYDEFTQSLTAFRKEKAKTDADLRWAWDVSSFSPTSSWTWWRAKAVKDEAEEIKKIREKEEKEEYERIQRRKKWIEDQEDAKNKKISEWQKIIQDYYEEVSKWWEKAQEAIKDITKDIEDLNKKLSDETQNKDAAIAERKLDILEREKQIKNELIDLENKWVNLRLAERISQETLDISWFSVFWSDQDTTENLQKAKDLQNELLKIKNESILNESVLDKATFDELQNYKSLSKTEQILLDFEKTKESIELEKSILIESLKVQEEEYTKINIIKENLEKQFTEFLKIETDSRITQLNRLKQAAIDAAKALKSAWVSSDSLVSSSTSSTSNNSAIINQTNNFTSKITKEDVKMISEQISKWVSNASVWIK